jgi:hypothetical protein
MLLDKSRTGIDDEYFYSKQMIGTFYSGKATLTQYAGQPES